MVAKKRNAKYKKLCAELEQLNTSFIEKKRTIPELEQEISRIKSIKVGAPEDRPEGLDDEDELSSTVSNLQS